MNTVAETPPNLKPQQDFDRLQIALVRLEQTADRNRVTIEGYRAVESAAFSLFSGLLQSMHPSIAREAQSAIHNALFLLDLNKSARKESDHA
jgi:hypothetical protein